MDQIVPLLQKVDWQSILFAALRIAVIVIVARLAITGLMVALGRLEAHLVHSGEAEGEVPSESSKRAGTLVKLLRKGVIILVWLVTALVALGQMGVQIGPLVAGAGIAGVAVGFGAQNLVRDVISGFFLILENQVRVGDVAVVNGTGGLVEQVNFRTLVLRDLSGTVHVFPNGLVTTLANMTRDWSGYVLDVGVAYKEDVDQVMDIMRKVGAQLRSDAVFGPNIVEDVEVFGLDRFADSAVMIKGRIKTRPIKQWEVGREYNRRLKQAFDSAGIEIPFPHRSLYFGEASKPFAAELLQNAAGEVSSGGQRPSQ
ncbi:MAG: mechanosensitive ion channel family protein [Gammaproteobacteria bacterium]